jgi:hypothetical protein
MAEVGERSLPRLTQGLKRKQARRRNRCFTASAPPIRFVAMADDSDPPRVYYQLKPREFERVNAPAVSPAPADPSAAVVPGLDPSAKIEVRDLLAQAAVPGPVLTQGEKVGVANEIHGILKENLNHANAAGFYELAPKPKRRSRRTRDYFLVIVPLNAFFAFAAFGPYANAVSFVYGIAGMIFSTVGITWVMFFVMDDY